MKWAMLILGALLAVVPFALTLTLNGLSLLGVVIMLVSAVRIALDDVREGL